MSNTINFFSEGIDYSLKNEPQIVKWIESVSRQHDFEINQINYIFCDDEYLLKVNSEHLDHHYYTDIITFDLAEEEGKLESDIFISIDRVIDNAKQIEVSFEHELQRVIIHGVLHLIGFNDKTSEEKTLMRKKEDACLSLLPEFQK